MIQEAVILAAGMGTRLRTVEGPKPLVPVGGVPLVLRAIGAASAAGARHVVVVHGYRGDEVRRAVELQWDAARSGTRLDFVYNDEYEKSLGISASKAEGAVDGPFLLAMADHVFDPAIMKRLAAADMAAADVYVSMDRRVDEIDDPEDATRVRVEGDRLVAISKQLDPYDGIDCGVFAASPSLFPALRRSRAELGQPTLSHGVEILAAAGRARVMDIGDAYWQDVDTPAALALAEAKVAAAEGRSRGVGGGAR